MTAKEYLSRLREVKRQQRILQEEIDELTIKAGYGTGKRYAKNISGTSRRCRMEDAILNKLELMKSLSERLVQQSELENEIMAAIFAVEDKAYQSILLLRYVRCYQWEQIAEEMNYSLRQVYEHHGRALQEVRVPKSPQ